MIEKRLVGMSIPYLVLGVLQKYISPPYMYYSVQDDYLTYYINGMPGI